MEHFSLCWRIQLTLIPFLPCSCSVRHDAYKASPSKANAIPCHHTVTETNVLCYD